MTVLCVALTSPLRNLSATICRGVASFLRAHDSSFWLVVLSSSIPQPASAFCFLFIADFNLKTSTVMAAPPRIRARPPSVRLMPDPNTPAVMELESNVCKVAAEIGINSKNFAVEFLPCLVRHRIIHIEFCYVADLRSRLEIIINRSILTGKPAGHDYMIWVAQK